MAMLILPKVFKMEPIWKKLNSEQYYNNVDINKSFTHLEEFVNWFLELKMPLLIPWNAHVLVTDDSTSICLYKTGSYMVELYLIHPNKTVPEHSHPGVEVITMYLDGGERNKPDKFNCGEGWGTVFTKINDKQTHGDTSNVPNAHGYVILAFQKWENDIEPTSASMRWRGPTAGIKHDTLIEKKYPNSIQNAGYADVTKSKSS
jgi:hypothetical protein